ncbi:MAG: sugar phosphate isomerase/epimerase [Lentisphaeria bacterium]|nr:sugar phosphate isomerase/epimerase [Lentisphaeria bacterium]
MDLKIGSIIPVQKTTDFSHVFDRLNSFGLHTCQICTWDMNVYDGDWKAIAATIREQMAAKDVQPSAWWAGYSGKVFWNFTEGPVSMGLVPAPYRYQRIRDLCHGADMAKELGLPAIITHCGFIPENMTDAEFLPTVLAIAEVAQYCKDLGIQFWFETGQETPVTLLRAIQRLESLGLDNLGINLDPANLLLYGKGNPIDALDVFGKYVRNIHVKDGAVPTNGQSLGPEKQVGQGLVNYPVFVKKLLSIGFDGEFIIEREIGENEEQARDIRETIVNLQKWANA